MKYQEEGYEVKLTFLMRHRNRTPPSKKKKNECVYMHTGNPIMRKTLVYRSHSKSDVPTNCTSGIKEVMKPGARNAYFCRRID